MKKRIIAYFMMVFAFTATVAMSPVYAAIDNTPDNDSVAIIKGGVFSEQALRQKAQQGDVPKVFGAFGITQGELNGFVEGVVYKDGRVTVGNDRVVARNAVTAGRWDTPRAGMTRIPGTNQAYKMPTSYFVDEGQTAYIKMVNNRFSFAIIKPCGNPVTATPVAPPTPGITVTKDVTTMKAESWQQTVTVRPGEHVRYKVVIKNTGKVALNTLNINENFPNGISQVASKLTINGKTMGNDLGSADINLPGLEPGQQHVIVYEATTRADESRPAACTTGLTNKVIIFSGDVLPDKSDTATVKVCAPPKAAYTCNTLQQSYLNIAERRVRFTASHSQSGGAQFKHYVYDFGDGTSPVTTSSATQDHQYASAGTYTARVTAVFMVNNQQQESTTTGCTQQVSFTSTPVPPSAPEQPAKDVPETLVDTGSGPLIGGILSTITGGSLAYRFIWSRRQA